MKWILIVYIILTPTEAFTSNLFTDPLLNFIYAQPLYTPMYPTPTVVDDNDRYDVEDNIDYNAEPESYSWDNLYLCRWCGIEVIVDPYADMAEDGVYDYTDDGQYVDDTYDDW